MSMHESKQLYYSNCKCSECMVDINNVEKLQVQLLQATTDKKCKQKGPNNYSRKQNKGNNMNKRKL